MLNADDPVVALAKGRVIQQNGVIIFRVFVEAFRNRLVGKFIILVFKNITVIVQTLFHQNGCVITFVRKIITHLRPFITSIIIKCTYHIKIAVSQQIREA